jgi:AcrR family transcriptional regulator
MIASAEATADPGSTPSRILDAAEALFAQHGFAGTAVRDIAASCELNPASLYNHFESKQALYEAVLARGIGPLIETLRRSAESGPGPLPADRLIDDVMLHLARTPHIPRLIYQEAASGGMHLARLAQRWIRPLVAQGVAAAKRETAQGWDDDEVPLMIMAWMNLVFSPFALAPLLAEVFSLDPLAPTALERQNRFLKKLARRLGVPAPAPRPSLKRTPKRKPR